VNPAHLFIGTQLDNVADMDAKGRRVAVGFPGSANARARLTEADVTAIRQLGPTERNIDIAAAFGITPTHVGSILKGKAWA
jgi:hypothetical protein